MRNPASDSQSSAAFSAKLSRNLIVQGLGLAMVSLMGLTVLPSVAVLMWSALAVCAVAVEHLTLRIADGDSRHARMASLTAPGLRFIVTSLYAVAALALMARGGPSARLFAVALMSASMMLVTMRYYGSPIIMVASIAPYLLVLGLICATQANLALAHGQWLAALCSTFTIGVLAVQLWSARLQLMGAWSALMVARSKAEEREQAADAANRAKSNFLAAMSHELRTPLNGVLGMAQALTSDQLTATQRERVKIIRRSGESLLSVLNDLLDLSKIESAGLELEMGAFDLEHLVRGVAAAFQPMANRKGLTFAFEVAPGAAGRYQGDSARIRRILYNLAENAVKFTDQGGVTLAVDREAGQLAFKITDTGMGIAQGDLDHLFDNFFQADASLSRRHGGAGLGLAVCRDLTGLMGGSIDVTSELGRGSVFVLRLPLAPADDDSAADPAAPSQQPAELRILAAEDNPTNQMVIKTLLSQVGVEPTVVEDGREALLAWERQAWDVILMDIQMPVMDGVAATRAIRSRELETGRARTPIIAVTANAMAHQLVEYEAAGMELVVPKPIDAATLFGAIEQVLAETEARAAAA
jgi:signal transduction histidine kinase/ActR/RegA family two-component response regulator